MVKIASQKVSGTLRDWLLVNRTGKLHSAQWRDLVTEPLVKMLLFMVPAIILLRSFLFTLLVGAWWMIGLALVVGLAGMLFLRAQRYARMPVQVATLEATTRPPPDWMFWRSWEFIDEAGQKHRFYKSLPHEDLGVEVGKTYLVYYLQEADRTVLLSLVSSDHPDIGKWRPTSHFSDRLKRRTTS